MPHEGMLRVTRMDDERRARLAHLEGVKKLTADDKGFLRTVRVTGTQQEADRALRLLEAGQAKSTNAGGKQQATVGDLPKLPRVLFDDDGNLL